MIGTSRVPQFLCVELAYGVDGNKWYGWSPAPQATRTEVLEPAASGSKRRVTLVDKDSTAELIICWPTRKEAGLAAKLAVRNQASLTVSKEILRLNVSSLNDKRQVRRAFLKPLLAKGWRRSVTGNDHVR